MDGRIAFKHEHKSWRPKTVSNSRPAEVTQSALSDAPDSDVEDLQHDALVLLVDVAEAFAGKALMSKLSPQYGLTAHMPAEILNGWDLSTVEGAQRWRSMILRERPLVVIIGFSCTHWTTLCNTNYAHRPEELESLRRVDRRMLRLMVWTMIEQSTQGRYFLFENPVGSQIWKEPAMEEVYDLEPNGFRRTGKYHHWQWMPLRHERKVCLAA